MDGEAGLEVGKIYTVYFDDLGRVQRKVFVYKGSKDGLAKLVNIRGNRVEFIPISRFVRVEEDGDGEQSKL